MEAGDDPYQILGVPIKATAAEIRSAYRRLAIQHHPDKQRTAEEKERVTPLFVKISNAYELLSDAEERARYDQQQQQQQKQDAAAGASSFANNNHHFAFHDPFQVFEQLFRSQVAVMQGGGGSMFPSSILSGGNLFHPMMNMGMSNSMMNATMADPLMSGFGGFMSPVLGNFMAPPLNINNDPSTGGSASFMTTFSSSTSSNNTGTQSVSVTTRIVNGRRETERIIRHTDGTVERIVETPDAIHQLNNPSIPQLPDTTELSSEGTLLSTASSPIGKRKTGASSPQNGKKQPKKRRKTKSPQEGDRDRPIVLE